MKRMVNEAAVKPKSILTFLGLKKQHDLQVPLATL
jgi:hypothetical protein